MKSTLKPAAILFAAAAMSALPSCATEEPSGPLFQPTLEALEGK